MKIMDQKPTQFLEKMGFTTLGPDEYAYQSHCTWRVNAMA